MSKPAWARKRAYMYRRPIVTMFGLIWIPEMTTSRVLAKRFNDIEESCHR